MARIEQGAKALNERKIPSSPAKPGFSKRIWEDIKTRAIAKRNALRSMAVALGIGVMVSCTPATLNAQETTARKEVAAAVEKSGVEYNLLTDASELEPYFKNAEGKIITDLKHRRTEKLGEYLVTAEITSGVMFSIESLDGTYKKQNLPFVSPMKFVNVLLIDMGENHPVVKGKMLVFTDYNSVCFQFFDKTRNTHALQWVSLLNLKGGVKRGPVNVGYGIDDDGVFVITAPKDLKPGDVLGQAGLWNDGTYSSAWFKYIPDQAPKQVAMK